MKQEQIEALHRIVNAKGSCADVPCDKCPAFNSDTNTSACSAECVVNKRAYFVDMLDAMQKEKNND